MSSVLLLLSVSAMGLGAPAGPSDVAPGSLTPAAPGQPNALGGATRDGSLDIADPEGWGLIPSFVDDFDSRRVDPERWSLHRPTDPLGARTMPNNGEQQVYADPGYLKLGINPIDIGPGQVTLVADKLDSQALASVRADLQRQTPELRNGVLKSLAYSSGRMTTLGHFAQMYGYFEIRTRFSAGRGLWPAFWLLPADGAWPPEIDVMEVVGHEPTRVHQTVHTAPGQVQHSENFLAPTPDGYHRYGVLWTPERIEFYTDGLHTGTAKTPPNAHRPMYMIVNLAVGGYWPGTPDAQTQFPAFMDIDYVRAWRFPEKNERTGQRPRR